MVTKERDALASRNPREKWAQNLGIRPASGEYRFEPTERPAITELAVLFVSRLGKSLREAS